MDSVSQFVLGAALAGAVLGQRTKAWKSLLWGGVVATLPDLDVLFDHGDAVANMTFHRAESHALLYLTLATPLLAWAIARLHGERHLLARWGVAVWLALVTHPLLDAMTIYGTQLLLPFTDHPFAVGSLFVVDPLYTLPLLLGNVVLLATRGSPRGHRANWAGLVLSTAYAAWSVLAQGMAERAGERALVNQGVVGARLVVTPAPLQTLLWRVLAVTDTDAYEGFWSVCDGDVPVVFTKIPRGSEWLPRLRGQWAVDRLQWFSGDCTKVETDGAVLRLVDLRMGQEPHYIFRFVVATLGADGAVVPVERTERSGSRIDVGRGLRWLWARTFDPSVPPPR